MCSTAWRSLDNLATKHITFPILYVGQYRLQLIVDIFLFDLGLPQCLSVINGSHIPNTDSLLHHKTSSITISLCSCSSMLTLSQSRQHCTGYKCMYLTKCLFAAIVLYKLYVLYIRKVYEVCLKCATSVVYKLFLKVGWRRERGKGSGLNMFHDLVGFNYRDWRTHSGSVVHSHEEHAVFCVHSTSQC